MITPSILQPAGSNVTASRITWFTSTRDFSMAVNSVFVMTGVKPVGNLGHDGEEIGA